MTNETFYAVTERNSNIIQAIIKEPFIEFFKKNLPIFDIIEIDSSVGITNLTVTDDDNNQYIVPVYKYNPILHIGQPLYPELYFIQPSSFYSKDDMNKIKNIIQVSTNIINNITTELYEVTLSIFPGMFIECWNGTKGYVIENNGSTIHIDDKLCPEIRIADIKHIHRTPKKKPIEPIIDTVGSLTAEESHLVPFEELNRDTILVTYHPEHVRFIDKGIGIKGYESLQKYDESGAMYELLHKPESLGYSQEDVKNLEMVAVKHPDGEYCIYTYDNGGVQAYKKDNTPTKCSHPMHARIKTHRGYHCAICGKRF